MLKTNRNLVMIIWIAFAFMITSCAQGALAQYKQLYRGEYYRGGCEGQQCQQQYNCHEVPEVPAASNPTPAPPPPPPAPPPPPPVTPPPPQQLATPTPIPPPFSPGVVVPNDVSAAAARMPAQPPGLRPLVQNLILLSDNKFPFPKTKDKGDGIIVRPEEKASIERPSPCSVKVHTGRVLVSVRRPSEVGLAITSLAEISLSSDSDVLIGAENGLVRVLNLDARGSACKIKLSQNVLNNPQNKIIAIKPGMELVFSNAKLSRHSLRPSDGIARRRSKMLEDGRIALTEFSLATVMQSCDLIVQLEQETSNSKTQRMLTDMSKMAAVLNYMNGPGFTYGGAGNQVATQGQPH